MIAAMSGYKDIGPVRNMCRTREFSRWFIVFHDGSELCLSTRKSAFQVAVALLDAGSDIHVFRETVIRSIIGDGPVDDTFRTDVTDRVR